MSFIRVKNILNKKTGKKYPYAYIVANSWKNKKVKQKVKKYLGRVYTFKRKEKSFSKFVGGNLTRYLEVSDNKKIVMDLVKWELINHGFKFEEDKYINEDCYFYPSKKKICKGNGKDISLAFNDGLLCGYLLRKLIRFDHKGDEEEVMYKFAKDFVELGIRVPHGIFIALYERIF